MQRRDEKTESYSEGFISTVSERLRVVSPELLTVSGSAASWASGKVSVTDSPPASSEDSDWDSLGGGGGKRELSHGCDI